MTKKNIGDFLDRYSPIVSFIIIVLAFSVLLTQNITDNPAFKSFHPVLIAITVILCLTVFAAFLLKDKARPLP